MMFSATMTWLADLGCGLLTLSNLDEDSVPTDSPLLVSWVNSHLRVWMAGVVFW